MDTTTQRPLEPFHSQFQTTSNDNITKELSFIQAHEGFQDSSIFHYKEDYSQYHPRGHYTQSEKLKRYFKTMMWYGRITFLLRGSDIVK